MSTPEKTPQPKNNTSQSEKGKQMSRREFFAVAAGGAALLLSDTESVQARKKDYSEYQTFLQEHKGKIVPLFAKNLKEDIENHPITIAEKTEDGLKKRDITVNRWKGDIEPFFDNIKIVDARLYELTKPEELKISKHGVHINQYAGEGDVNQDGDSNQDGDINQHGGINQYADGNDGDTVINQYGDTNQFNGHTRRGNKNRDRHATFYGTIPDHVISDTVNQTEDLEEHFDFPHNSLRYGSLLMSAVYKTYQPKDSESNPTGPYIAIPIQGQPMPKP